MRSLLRGLAGALLILGLATLTGGPSQVAAQAKKDTKDPKAPAPKADPKKDDTRDKTVGIMTSDGLSLTGYFFQGNATDKQAPDAVLMFPAPGGKVNDAWIGLAKKLSEKNFSVLLFDWRGCGMNDSASAGSRILADTKLFWTERYNEQLLKPQRTYEDRGLDYRTIKGKSNGRIYYSDFLPNDLLAARFYLDKMNDNGKCNTNRVWIVTEKSGGPLALAFIASEFNRNTIYQNKQNLLDTTVQVRGAGKDYVGLTVLSYGAGELSSTASAVWSNSFKQLSGPVARDARDYLEHRLAMVLVHGKKEGTSGSRSALSLVQALGDEDTMKKNYKYVREIDNSKQAKVVTGIDLIDPMDTFGVQKLIQDNMVGISVKLPTGKDRTERDANKMTYAPRFNADALGRR
jgi:hypothetical protein